MTRKTRWALVVVAVMVGVLAGLLFFSQRAQFMAGGALVNLGFRMQDSLDHFDFSHDESISPQEVWVEVLEQNHLAASVRKQFPRTARHPMVAMVVCMDARIDTAELVGDTRKYYYVVRTAGSVMSAQEEDMIELAVDNGIKVLVLTRHSDCAAESAAADPQKRRHLPHLATAIDERDARIKELLARPHIAERVASGQLLVKHLNIDTMTEELLPSTQQVAGPGTSAH